MSNLGWKFWRDANIAHQMKGVRIFEKEGFYCICEKGVEPGDADSFIRSSMLAGFAVFWQLVDEGKFTPDTLTTLP